METQVNEVSINGQVYVLKGEQEQMSESVDGLEYKIVIGKKGLQNYIIIWRNFDEPTIDLKAEKEFITKQEWFNTTDFVFCNGDNAFSAHPIEPEFIRLMNEPVL